MPSVKLSVNNKTYEVICEEGEETHLTQLATYIDEKARALGLSPAQAGESRLLLLASLLITDELFETHEEVRSLKKRLDELSSVSLDADTQDLLEQARQKIITISQRLTQVAGA